MSDKSEKNLAAVYRKSSVFHFEQAKLCLKLEIAEVEKTIQELKRNVFVIESDPDFFIKLENANATIEILEMTRFERDDARKENAKLRDQVAILKKQVEDPAAAASRGKDAK